MGLKVYYAEIMYFCNMIYESEEPEKPLNE